MSSENKLVVELWDYFRDMIPAGKRSEAAVHTLRLFEEYGFEFNPAEIEGECDYLDEALLSFDNGSDSYWNDDSEDNY